MDRVRTGIIGCGKVAHLHAAALKKLDESEFVAVCGRNLDRTTAFADQYGVKAYIDVEEMVSGAHVEAVMVCTPHPAHAGPAVAAADAGAHILVEKPLASSLEDCDDMLQAARRAGVKIGTISQRRFYAPCRRVKEAIDDGKIGKPILGCVAMYGWRDQAYYESDAWRGTWEGEGGGLLVNQAPHQLDLLHWFMGPVEELSGYWSNLNHPYIEVEDTAVAVLRFKNGALGNIVLSNSQNPALYGKVNVCGDNGACVGVQTDGGAMFIAGMSEIEEPAVNDLWTVPGEDGLLDQWRKEDTDFFAGINPMEYYHHLQIKDFLESVMADVEPMVTGEDGRKTVELFTAIYRSQRDGKPIEFPLKAEKEGGVDLNQ
jgi:UDP-N-acetyl-2-amino-2-deoxyglucuronate dehydrogenase